MQSIDQLIDEVSSYISERKKDKSQFYSRKLTSNTLIAESHWITKSKSTVISVSWVEKQQEGTALSTDFMD